MIDLIRISLGFLTITLVAACAPKPEQQVLGGASMGTSWSAKIISSEMGQDNYLVSAAIQQRLDDIEAKMSNWRSDSEVSRFNAMAAGCMAMSADTLTVVDTALTLSSLSEGAFDVTLGPIIELWGFGKRIGTDDTPSAESIAQSLTAVAYQSLSIEANTLCKDDAAISINLSALAKGYAVDEAAAVLRQLGYENYLIEVGGELFAEGVNLSAKPWAIGVEKPVANDRRIMENIVIPLQAKGLATSGDYRNFFEKEGRRYSHLIEPSTGYPVQHQVASVSVVAESAMLADAWATAFQVMGAKRALPLANQLGLAVLILEYGVDDEIIASTSEHWFD